MESSDYSSKVPFDLDVPPQIDAAWMKSVEAWKKLAIEQPVSVQWMGKNGEIVMSKVHVLGLPHHSPANSRAMAEVIERINPCAIGMEATENSLGIYKIITDSPILTPLLTRLTETPITSIKQAIDILSVEDREQYERGYLNPNPFIRIPPLQEGRHLDHYRFGQPSASELLGAAFLCKKRKLPLVAIDTDWAARELFERKSADMMSSHVEGAWWRNWISSYHKEAALEYDRWISDSTGFLERRFKSLLVDQCCLPLTSSQYRAYNQATFLSEAYSADRDREATMAGQIRQLYSNCSNGIASGSYKTVLVIVGQSHVTPLIDLLGERQSSSSSISEEAVAPKILLSYDQLMEKRASEIKRMLGERNIYCADCFDKESLAKRLIERST